jgi:hypothetical protein
LQQQQQLQQLSLNSPTAQQQQPVRRSSLMLPNTNPFGQVEETLTMISPRSGAGGGGGQHSRNPSSSGSGIPVSPGSAGGGGGGGMHVRARTGNLSFGQGTWPGKRPSGWSSGDMMAAAAAAAASGDSGAPTPTRSPRPTIITANLNNNATATATQQSSLLQRANSLPQQQPNPFAVLERELSPHPSQGQPSFGFNPQQHVAVPVTPVSHHRGSFSGAGGATAVPRSPNPFLALEASQQQQQQQQLQQLQQFQAEQQGQVTPKHMSRRPSHLVSQAQQAAQLRIIDEARIGTDSSLRSSANPSPSRDQQHGAPSPLTRAASLSGSTPTPSSLSQRSRANSVSSTLASSLPLAGNPFAHLEDVLSPTGSARSRRPSTMFVAPPLNNGTAGGGSPVVAAVVASPEAGPSSDSVPAHDKLGQMFGLQPSPVRPSPQLVEPTSAQVNGSGGAAAPGASSSSASSSSTSVADVSSSCASLRQLSPHLSLLLDAVTLESHDESRDRSEALELREYKLAETRKHIQRIQDAREAQQREHQGRMAAVEAQIAAALEAQKEEERKTAVQTLALEEERAKLEQRLRAIEQRTNAHALQLLHRQSELDDWATGSQKQQLISLSMQREEHEHASATTRARVRERVVEHVLQAPEDVLDLLRERLEARRTLQQQQQQQSAKSPTPAAGAAAVAASSSKSSPSASSSAAGERSSTPLATAGTGGALSADVAAPAAHTLPSSAPAASSPLSA